jgi:transporter family-2 protein
MHTAVDFLLAIMLGGTISCMVVLNTRLGEIATMPVSFLINHLVGIVVITIIMIILRIKRGKPAVRQPAPWYLWGGGIFGFFILNANYLTIVHIGASLSMAVSFVGIVIMASQGGTFAIPYVLIGTLTGVTTIVQMVYNSRFAAYKGIFYSARHNVLSGFIFASVIYLITAAKPVAQSFSLLSEIPIFLILGGGLLAIVVVSGTNYVIPRIPAIYSALLLSSSQIIMSIILDYYLYDLFNGRLLLGAMIILIGMGANVWVDRTEQRNMLTV